MVYEMKKTVPLKEFIKGGKIEDVGIFTPYPFFNSI